MFIARAFQADVLTSQTNMALANDQKFKYAFYTFFNKLLCSSKFETTYMQMFVQLLCLCKHTKYEAIFR